MENIEPPISDSSGVEAVNHAQTQTLRQNSLTRQRQLLIYLIPVIGVLPSLWTLYHRQGNREQMKVSRLSITMTFTWLLAYLLLATGSATSEFFGLRLLILNSFLTSGYFLVSIWLMFRIIRGQSSRLPGLSNLAEQLLGKYLS
ncbi:MULTISPECIES: hypothetical protein [unclassified Nostoc]|uniref:hypothetical protein n=1 Tax=unclassified Nostoc TaxID=2593658 RepID=UPI001F559551|nr:MULTISPECIES: hypothetical protein [unclassified Nostoc]